MTIIAEGSESAAARAPSRPGSSASRTRTPRARVIRGAVGVLVFLAAAEAATRSGLVDPQHLPPPSVVVRRNAGLLTDSGFLSDVGLTVQVWLAGLALAAGIGIPVGVLFGTVPVLATAGRALIEFLRPIPSVALIVPAMMVFGAGTRMQITLTVYASVWPILFNTTYALRDVDPLAKETARSFGFGPLAVLARVSLPAAAPFIATGVRIAAGIALIVPIGVELLAGGERGIGVFLLQATGAVDRTDMVLAGAVAAGFLGYAGNLLLEGLERRLFRWHFARHEGQS